MDNNEIKEMRQYVKNGDLLSVKKMIENNHELINAETPFGTWLEIAANHGQIDIVKYFIDCKMDVNKSVGVLDGSPIESAASEGHLDIVKLLYENGAVLDVSDADRNPLFAAIYGGHFDVVKFLVEKGIDITVTYAIGSIDQCDACEYARQYGQTEIYNYLKELKEHE